MEDTILRANDLTIVLPDSQGWDRRYNFSHPEMILDPNDIVSLADYLVPWFSETVKSTKKALKSKEWTDKQVKTAIACSLYLYYLKDAYEDKERTAMH